MRRSRYKLLKRVPRGRVSSSHVSIVTDRRHDKWTDLLPLLPSHDKLKGLIINADVDDISAAAFLTQLRSLHIGEYAAGGFDLSSLVKLEDFSLDVGLKRAICPGGGNELKQLTLFNCSRPWADWIETLPCLESLSLNYSRSYPLSFPESMGTLEISGARRWKEKVFSGPAGLDKLSLVDVRGMRDLTDFSFARSLSFLYLEDCQELESIEGPRLAWGAKVLRVGRTPGRSDN